MSLPADRLGFRVLTFMMRRAICVVLLSSAISSALGAGTVASAVGNWTWPVIGPIIRGYDPPSSPYGSGHRGIDIASPYGTTVVAAAPGTISFAGPVGGHLFITVDHGSGLASTYSWVSKLLVKKGAPVVQGQPIALSGYGHPGETPAHLHFGVKQGDAYLDPMLYLSPMEVSSFVRLAPIP